MIGLCLRLSECGNAVRTARYKKDNIGIMFLSEVALGKEHDITVDNWRLTCAPKGYDSIVARGQTEPGRHSSSFGQFHSAGCSCMELFYLEISVSMLEMQTSLCSC